jgi:predicted metal-dependent hydrolase
VSKRCCPVCSHLLYLLNKTYKTNFIISDEHTNITPCALPEWLSEEIVLQMVMEFSRRLREELNKLKRHINQQRTRASTTDTARVSLDSVMSQKRRWPTTDEYNAAAESLGDSETE